VLIVLNTAVVQLLLWRDKKIAAKVLSDREVPGDEESESLPQEGSDVDKKGAVRTSETLLVTVE
jgi:ACS family pantothenate transporter-like MFS transporter